MLQSKPNVVCLQETWTKASTHSDLDISVPGYTVYRHDRIVGEHGGVITYICNDTASSDATSNTVSKDYEVIWNRIATLNKTLYVANIYRPPNNDGSIFNALAADVEALQLRKDRPIILIVGDFNCHHPAWLGSKDCHGNAKCNEAGNSGYEFCQTMGLTNMVKSNTYFRNTGRAVSILDLAVTDSPSLISNVELMSPFGCSPHACISLKIKLAQKISKHYSKTSWKYHRADWDSMKRDLSISDWRLLKDADTTWLKFKDNIIKAMKCHIPQTTVKRHFKDQPWFTDTCAIACAKKVKLWKRFQKSCSPDDKMLYDQQRAKCLEVYKIARTYYKESIADKLTDDSTSIKQWWSIVNHVVSESCHTEIPTLTCNNVYYDGAKEKAEIFKDIFAAKSTINDGGKIPDFLSMKSSKSLNNVKIRAKCVLRKLCSLKTNKATGPDGIPARVLKECAHVLHKPLASLFTLSFKTGIVPSEWKCANVVPIYKSGGKSDPNNYRPISLLSIVSKVMEGVINDCLRKHMFGLKLITEHQYGFRPKHSTLDLLTSTTQRWTNALDKGSEVKVVALDISRAFDSVWHSGLLSKLMAFGVGGCLYRWIRSFLTGRYIRVVVNGQESGIAAINAGVPQGSILGPTLFLAFINDLAESMENNIDLFADDTTLSAVIRNCKNKEVVIRSLQSDLENVTSWAKKWIVTFNAKKTQVMTISRKRDKTNDFPLSFCGEQLEETNCIKLVGINITNSLNWGYHADKVAMRSGQRLGIIRRARRLLPVSALASLYKSKVRSVMEYCSPIWQGASKSTLGKLDVIQRKATRCMGYHGDCIPDFHIFKLEQRRNVSGGCQLYRMMFNIAPSAVCNLLPPVSVPQRNSRAVNSCHHLQLSVGRSSTQHHMKSLVPHFSRLWNSLPNDVLYSSNGEIHGLESFKKSLNRYLLASR